MDVRVELVTQRIVYHAMALQQRLTHEPCGDDMHAVMARAATRAGMADVLVTVVDNIELKRRETALEHVAHVRHAVVAAHGRVFLFGRTVSRALSPPAKYGSSFALCWAASNVSNSATGGRPGGPAGPG